MAETTRIEEAVTDHFGVRCEAFDPDCMSCQAWAEIQAIKDTPLRFADLIDTQDREIEELAKALEQIEQDVTQTAFGAKPTRGAEIARTTLSTIQAKKDGQ